MIDLLWQRSKCRSKFVTKNMWHSCCKYKPEKLFAKSESHVFKLYKQFVTLITEQGHKIINTQISRIAFQVQVRFAGCTPRKKYLICHFWFKRRHDSQHFYKIKQYTQIDFGHFTKVFT